MPRFAILESNSGFVWGVVDANSALEACHAVDSELGDGGRYVYEAVNASELRSTRGCFDVRIAPSGFDVEDGQDLSSIADVEALPRAGIFASVED